MGTVKKERDGMSGAKRFPEIASFLKALMILLKRKPSIDIYILTRFGKGAIS